MGAEDGLREHAWRGGRGDDLVAACWPRGPVHEGQVVDLQSRAQVSRRFGIGGLGPEEAGGRHVLERASACFSAQSSSTPNEEKASVLPRKVHL